MITHHKCSKCPFKMFPELKNLLLNLFMIFYSMLHVFSNCYNNYFDRRRKFPPPFFVLFINISVFSLTLNLDRDSCRIIIQLNYFDLSSHLKVLQNRLKHNRVEFQFVDFFSLTSYSNELPIVRSKIYIDSNYFM